MSRRLHRAAAAVALVVFWPLAFRSPTRAQPAARPAASSADDVVATAFDPVRGTFLVATSAGLLRFGRDGRPAGPAIPLDFAVTAIEPLDDGVRYALLTDDAREARLYDAARGAFEPGVYDRLRLEARFAGGAPEQTAPFTRVSPDPVLLVAGQPFDLVVQAAFSGGVLLEVESSSPAVACPNPPPLSGLTTIPCTTSAVTEPTLATVTLRALGATLSFSVVLMPPGVPDGLAKISGDNRIVGPGAEAELTVEARRGGLPRPGVTVTAASLSTLATCPPAPATTNAFGRATLRCAAAAAVAAPGAATIVLTDDLGFTASFTLNVTAQGGPAVGLARLDVNPLDAFAGRGFVLGVEARTAAGPRAGATLTIETGSDAARCPASAITGADGRAAAVCGAADVPFDTSVAVVFRDGPETAPYTVNVLRSEPPDGLRKVSGDEQIVGRDILFPLPLVVRAVANGVPQAGLALAVRADRNDVFCPTAATTDSNGLAEIACAAGAPGVEAIAQIQVADPSGRTLPSPFRATLRPTPPTPATRLSVVGGASVAGRIGERLAEGVRLRAESTTGAPVAGAAVFARGPQGAVFRPARRTTETNGDTVFDIAFGCAPPNGRLSFGLAPETTAVEVDYMLAPGPFARLAKIRGDNQTGSPGVRLPQALVARATDACGSAIPGVALGWSVHPPSAAALEAPTTLTNAQGEASVLVRPSSQGGPFEVRATAAGGAIVAAFALTTGNVPTSLRRVSGDGQNVAAGEAAALPLVVEALNEAGQPVGGADVNFRVLSGAATLSATAARTDAQGRASVAATAGFALGPAAIEASGVGEPVVFTLHVRGRRPVLRAEGFVNGASFRPGLVPGSTASIFGTGLADGARGAEVAPYDPATGFPLEFRGARVTINGVDCPILGLMRGESFDQVNIQVPFGLAQGQAEAVVVNNGTAATLAGIPVFGLQPGVFSWAGPAGRPLASALHADFRPVTPADPARPGDVVLLFLTGLGRTEPAAQTNVAGPAPPFVPVARVVVGLDDAGQETLGAFYAPGLISVYQINFRVGAGVAAGERRLSVSADGVPGPDVFLPVGPAR